jgi:saccharopepsin
VVRISVSNQAFLDSNDANNPALIYGASGICGIGFNSLSTINALINGSAGRSLLYNIFLENKTAPNYISMSLQRDSDQNDTADGMFAVGKCRLHSTGQNGNLTLFTCR